MSDTPIYDAMKAEADWAWMSRPFEPVTGSAWVEILPDTTKFLAGMRVAGRRFGRSAAHERLLRLNSSNPIRDFLSAWPYLEGPKPRPSYSNAVHDLASTTGWSLDESADMYERVAKWSADAITEDNIKALNRSRMSKQSHYPTSTPSWARKARR